MILSLLALVVLQQPTAACEFFPISTGTVRTYDLKQGGDTLVNTVGKPMDQGGVPIIPITEGTGGMRPKTTYYHVEDNQVSIVAYDLNYPLPLPMPVLKIGKGKIKWDYEGKTQTGPNGERLLAHGESRMVGQRKVLGNRIDVLEIKLVAEVGSGLSGVTFDQTAYYGRGVGLIELTTKMMLGKKTETTTYQLTSLEPGKADAGTVE